MEREASTDKVTQVEQTVMSIAKKTLPFTSSTSKTMHIDKHICPYLDNKLK
jgi:hypothetical protein